MLAEVTKHATRLAQAQVGRFDRAARARAADMASRDAAAYVRDESARLIERHQQLVREAERWWSALRSNDEDVVCETLNIAFSDNPAGGLAVGVAGATASVVIRQPDWDTLPTKRPDLTPTGKPTLRTLAQRDRHRLFLESTASCVAATLLEGFAVAPGLEAMTVAVLTRVRRTQRLGVVLLGRWTRDSVGRTSWGSDGDALTLVLDRADELHLHLAATGEVKALPATVPHVGQVLELAEDDPDLADPEPVAGEDEDPLLPRPFLQWVAEGKGAPLGAPDAVPRRALAPGAVVSLEPGDLTAPLTLSVTAQSGAEVDLCALLLGADGRVRGDADLVFYNAPTSPAHAVALGVPRQDGASTHCSITVDLSRLDREGVARVALVASTDPSPLMSLDAARVAMWRAGGPPVVLPLPDEPGVTAGVLAEVYQRGLDGPWRVRAVGQGWTDGLSGLVRSYGVAVD
ncbi:TerD family protein [Rhodococcus aerolatus]